MVVGHMHAYGVCSLYQLQPIWKFLGCGNLAARLKQACDNLALTFARCTQPCNHPLQGAHNLIKVVYKLYNLV